jgi:hypothetical protein
MNTSRHPISRSASSLARGALLLGLTLTSSVGVARAGPPLDIPFAAPNVVANMEKTHANARVTPNDDQKLAFSLAIPKSWAYSKKFGPVPSGLFRTRGLAFFTNSTSPDAPVIAATLTPVPYEVPLDAWALSSFAKEGWKVVSSQWVPGRYGLFFDVTGTRVDKGVEHVRRTSVRADGANIFSLNAMCGRSHWDEAKGIFWVAHATFEILHQRQEQMETWMKATAKGPDFQVAYPKSWSPEAVPPQHGVSAVDVRLIERQSVMAYLQVKAERLPKTKPPAALEARKAEAMAKLAKAGFTPSGAPQALTEKDDPRSIAVKGWKGGFIVPGRLGNTPAMARLGFVDDDGLSFTLIALGPPLAADPLTALRAQRAFEIARFTAGAAE